MNPRRLLRRFAMLAIASVTAILVLVGMGLYSIYRGQLIEGAQGSAVAVAQAILAQERQVLVETTPEGRARIAVAEADFASLDARMRAFLAPFGIVKIKVYDGGRKIVYSTDESLVGRVDADNAKLGRVLRLGELDSQLVKKEKVADLHGQERFSVDVVETYLPVRVGDAIVGSFEVYVDISPAYEKLVTAVQLSMAVLLSALILVFGALFVPMRRGAIRLEQVEDQLRDLAATDMLTGLFNRRHLFVRIGEEYSRMERARLRREPRECLGFIMIDIDNFKAINDAHGHQTGDEVLRQMALRLKGLLRPYDIVGRYGGEEFLVMLPHTDLAEAGIVAERVRRSVSETPFDIRGIAIPVTVSLGVAHSADAQEDVKEVIRRADEGLYRAKNAGRDKVVSVA